MNKTEIKKLVEFALSDKLNQHKKISLGLSFTISNTLGVDAI